MKKSDLEPVLPFKNTPPLTEEEVAATLDAMAEDTIVAVEEVTPAVDTTEDVMPSETPSFVYIKGDVGNAVRADLGKLRYDLLPPGPQKALVEALTYGANKYAERNWEQGMAYSRIYASLMRHLQAWWAGEDTDSESGLPHLAHVACNVMFLQHLTDVFPEGDDRVYR